MKPFEESLTENLIIIPDGPLFDFPFGALPRTSHQIKRQNYGAVPYLIKDFNLSYANSIRTLLNQMEYNFPVDENYLGASVENDTSSYLGNLTQTIKEVLNAQRIFGGHVLLEAKLDEFQKYITEYKYNIIHFAMHASSNDPKTNTPAIYFSDKTYGINMIYASDIIANLVVLSVCEAGNGEQVAGEGVLSIARAFAFNRVPSILTSLSRVEDHSSAFLIGKFYKNINASQRKDVALKMAKLEIINGKLDNDDSSAMPYNWASFVLVGDTEPLTFNRDEQPSLWDRYFGIFFFVFFTGIFYASKFFGF